MSKETSLSEETIDSTTSKKGKKDMSLASSPVKAQVGGMSSDSIYKNVIEREERVAIERDGEQDFILFCSCGTKFKDLVREIHKLKTSNHPEAEQMIQSKRMEAILLFVNLRELNRLEKVRMNQNRETQHKTKHLADNCYLQWQNLLYETLHLEKEITKCLQFKSKDEEIDLVSVEEFFKHAPESISRPDVTRVDSHQLKLARLEWELQQRKQLSAMCQNLLSEIEKVTAASNKKQRQIENLTPMLQDLDKASRPVQEALNLTVGPSLALQKIVQMLPHPLYFLFVQTEALREAGEKCVTVKIEGDETEAKRVRENFTEDVTPEDSDSDTQEEGREMMNKRHGQRKKSRQERMEERRNQLLMAHPLTVVMTITLKDGHASIRLEFSYLMKLHVITVRPKIKLSPNVNISPISSVNKLIDSEHILMELFPNDFGEDSPNFANHYQLQQVGIESFNISSLGLPYLWAQRICGFNFTLVSNMGTVEEEPIAPVPSRLVSQMSLPKTVKAIKERLKGRIALCENVQILESGKLDTTGIRNHFPPRMVAELIQFGPVSWEEFQSFEFTQRLITGHIVSEKDILYKGFVSRGNAGLRIAVVVKHSYPYQAPVFALQATYEGKTIDAANNDSIQELEREVNLYFKDLIVKTKSIHTLLVAMVLRLITNFDILLEASSNQDFPRDKTFKQSTRGRTRTRPFKQVEVREGTYNFTQR